MNDGSNEWESVTSRSLGSRRSIRRHVPVQWDTEFMFDKSGGEYEVITKSSKELR